MGGEGEGVVGKKGGRGGRCIYKVQVKIPAC